MYDDIHFIILIHVKNIVDSSQWTVSEPVTTLRVGRYRNVHIHTYNMSTTKTQLPGERAVIEVIIKTHSSLQW